MSTLFALTRRTFLGGLGALLLARCGGGDDQRGSGGGAGGPGDGGIDGGNMPFDAWRMLRDALSASPDNLPAHAQKLPPDCAPRCGRPRGSR